MDYVINFEDWSTPEAVVLGWFGEVDEWKKVLEKNRKTFLY